MFGNAVLFTFGSAVLATVLVLNDPISLLSLRNNLSLGLSGATLGVMLSIFVAYVIVKVCTVAAGILESLSFLSFSFPGIVIGVGFMLFFVRTPLYGTLWALLIGYIATYLPYGIKPLPAPSSRSTAIWRNPREFAAHHPSAPCAASSSRC